MRPPVKRASRQNRAGRWRRCRPHVAAVLLVFAHLAPAPVYAQNSLRNQARAEIARVYLMLGELRTSQQAFATVSKNEDLPPAAQPIASERRPC